MNISSLEAVNISVGYRLPRLTFRGEWVGRNLNLTFILGLNSWKPAQKSQKVFPQMPEMFTKTLHYVPYPCDWAIHLDQTLHQLSSSPTKVTNLLGQRKTYFRSQRPFDL